MLETGRSMRWLTVTASVQIKGGVSRSTFRQSYLYRRSTSNAQYLDVLSIVGHRSTKRVGSLRHPEESISRSDLNVDGGNVGMACCRKRYEVDMGSI
jgi:hypothetical protein